MNRLRRSIALSLLAVSTLFVGVAPAAAEPWPVRSLPIFARAAVGVTKTGPFTEVTKRLGFGEYVTWRFAIDPVLGWSSLVVERAEKRADGTWGPFTSVGTVLVDDTGVAYYAMTSSRPLAVSIRSLYPAHPSLTMSDSRSPARQAVWMASPPRPLALTGGTAISPSTTFTTSLKVACLGRTVTWRWSGPAKAAHQWAAVWISERAPSGLWGPFADAGVLIQFDAHAVATWRTHYTTPTWISARLYLPAGSPPVPETWSTPLQARWR